MRSRYSDMLLWRSYQNHSCQPLTGETKAVVSTLSQVKTYLHQNWRHVSSFLSQPKPCHVTLVAWIPLSGFIGQANGADELAKLFQGGFQSKKGDIVIEGLVAVLLVHNNLVNLEDKHM